jgi:hypothetical protein
MFIKSIDFIIKKHSVNYSKQKCYPIHYNSKATPFPSKSVIKIAE